MFLGIAEWRPIPQVESLIVKLRDDAHNRETFTTLLGAEALAAKP
jgi:16S rRNA A1518/A1519 N6-dimethyltransferase RsmA/KsgA/DIM1 with predicted DNA glycosylase/AP lyase activity